MQQVPGHTEAYLQRLEAGAMHGRRLDCEEWRAMPYEL